MKTSAFILFAALLAASSLSVTGRAATRTIDLCGRVTASGRGVTGGPQWRGRFTRMV